MSTIQLYQFTLMSQAESCVVMIYKHRGCTLVITLSLIDVLILFFSRPHMHEKLIRKSVFRAPSKRFGYRFLWGYNDQAI